MIEPIKIEGEKNKEMKLKLNEVITLVNKDSEHLSWVIANLKSILEPAAPPSPTSPHSGESLNGLVSSNRFTVQTASQESVDPSVLEHDEPEEPVGTVRELGNGYVDVKRERGWERMKEEDYLKQNG